MENCQTGMKEDLDMEKKREKWKMAQARLKRRLKEKRLARLAIRAIMAQAKGEAGEEEKVQAFVRKFTEILEEALEGKAVGEAKQTLAAFCALRMEKGKEATMKERIREKTETEPEAKGEREGPQKAAAMREWKRELARREPWSMLKGKENIQSFLRIMNRQERLLEKTFQNSLKPLRFARGARDARLAILAEKEIQASPKLAPYLADLEDRVTWESVKRLTGMLDSMRILESHVKILLEDYRESQAETILKQGEEYGRELEENARLCMFSLLMAMERRERIFMEELQVRLEREICLNAWTDK